MPPRLPKWHARETLERRGGTVVILFVFAMALLDTSRSLVKLRAFLNTLAVQRSGGPVCVFNLRYLNKLNTICCFLFAHLWLFHICDNTVQGF